MVLHSLSHFENLIRVAIIPIIVYVIYIRRFEYIIIYLLLWYVIENPRLSHLLYDFVEFITVDDRPAI